MAEMDAAFAELDAYLATLAQTRSKKLAQSKTKTKQDISQAELDALLSMTDEEWE